MSTFVKTIKGVTTIFGDTSIHTKKFGTLSISVVLVSNLSGNRIETLTSLRMGNKNLATIRTILLKGNIVRQRACFGKGLFPGIRNINLTQTTRNNKTVIRGLVNGERIVPFTPRSSKGCKCKCNGCSCGAETIQFQNGKKLSFTITKQLQCALKLLFAKFNVEVAAAIRRRIGNTRGPCQDECNKLARKCNADCFFDSVCAPACEAARLVCILKCVL